MKGHIRLDSTVLILSGAFLACSGPAFAQASSEGDKQVSAVGRDDVGQLEEIVVTAQKREQSSQSVPIAISVLGQDALKDVQATNLFDVARLAPNVQFGNGEFGQSIFVRGIGAQQSSLLADGGVTLYIDGVYRPRIAGNTANTADVSRIEVLRGPQGTLFGKNAIGGALSIITVLPDNELGGDISARYGSRDRVEVDASLNIPLGAEIGTRFSVQFNKQDGFMKDAATGARLNDTDYYTVRNATVWKATPDLTLTVRGDYTRQKQNGPGYKLIFPTDSPYYVPDDPYITYGTAPSYLRAKDGGVSATIDWQVGPGAVRSITAYRKLDFQFSEDFDATPQPIQNSPQDNKEHFVSQELQYNGNGLDGALTYTVGAFYLNEVIRGKQQVILPFIAFNNVFYQKTRSYAGFAQGTYNFNDRLSVTLGLRYSLDKKTVNFSSAIAGGPQTINLTGLKDSWGAWTGKGVIQYKIDPNIMVYASASQGYKSGGYNGTPLQPSDFRPFGPEHLWNYELGLKSEVFDRRLRANIAIYQMDYSDIQQTIDKSPNLYIANSGNARIRGIEADVSFLPLPALRFDGTFGYNDFKFTKLSAQVLAAGLSYDNISPNSPKVTASAGAQYTLGLGGSGNVTIRSDYAWRSKTYFSAFNTPITKQSSYGVLSARLTYRPESGRWSLFAYGNNLTSKVYHTSAISAFANIGLLQGPPRELGAGANLSF